MSQRVRGFVLGLIAVSVIAGAATGQSRAGGPPGREAAAFPAPDRPVASIVSPEWGNLAARDTAHEVEQIAARLSLRAGMTVADIGAGDGYDSLGLAHIVGQSGLVVAEDITPSYLDALRVRVRGLAPGRVVTVLGEPHDPRLRARSIDAAIMVHMYHEIQSPYALLYNLAPAFRTHGRIGVEELDRPTQAHGTPPALLICEFEALGYRKISLAPLNGALGYFAVFEAPAPNRRPAPSTIKACHA